MLEQFAKIPWNYNIHKKDITVEVNILDSDDQAAWSIADVNKYMQYIGKSPDGSHVLMMGKETLTYYLLRRADLKVYVDHGIAGAWIIVHHVEIVIMVDPETSRCPECGSIDIYHKWNPATGEKVK